MSDQVGKSERILALFLRKGILQTVPCAICVCDFVVEVVASITFMS